MDNFSTKLLTGASAGLAAVALAAVAVQSGENIFNWQCFWLTGLIFLFATSALRRVEWQPASRSGQFVIWCAGWSYSLYLLHHTILMDYPRTLRGGMVPAIALASRSCSRC